MEPQRQVESFSDSSDEEEQVVANELYDEDADDEDQQWVNKHWRQEATRQGKAPGPATDAVLNCPCCFTTVCMDCQRHAIYKTQYRAMFIINCTVKANVNLGEQTSASSAPPPPSIPPATAATTPSQPQGEEGSSNSEQQKKRGKQVSWDDTPDGQQPALAVMCETCGTVVGVQDEDDVTHFFNVIAS